MVTEKKRKALLGKKEVSEESGGMGGGNKIVFSKVLGCCRGDKTLWRGVKKIKKFWQSILGDFSAEKKFRRRKFRKRLAGSGGWEGSTKGGRPEGIRGKTGLIKKGTVRKT